MIHSHCKGSKIQTRKRSVELQGGQREFRAQGGIIDMGTAKKADTQAEREVTRNRRAPLHPPLRTRVVAYRGNKSALDVTQHVTEKSPGPRSRMQKIRSLYSLSVLSADKAKNGSISPRCGPLLRQVWVEKQTEEEEEEKEKWGNWRWPPADRVDEAGMRRLSQEQNEKREEEEKKEDGETEIWSRTPPWQLWQRVRAMV